jgi:hypothetical protein
MPTNSGDIVAEARGLLATYSVSAFRVDMSSVNIRQLVEVLCDEVERLRGGDFTPQEFQNLCHNTDIQAGFEAFADGCEAYQQKMFGRCRTKGKVL